MLSLNLVIPSALWVPCGIGLLGGGDSVRMDMHRSRGLDVMITNRVGAPGVRGTDKGRANNLSSRIVPRDSRKRFWGRCGGR